MKEWRKNRPPFSDEEFREKIAGVQSSPAVKTDPETAAAIHETLAEEACFPHRSSGHTQSSTGLRRIASGPPQSALVKRPTVMCVYEASWSFRCSKRTRWRNSIGLTRSST